MPRSASRAALTRAVITESWTMRLSLSSMAAAYSVSESRPSLSVSNAAQRFWTSGFASASTLLIYPSRLQSSETKSARTAAWDASPVYCTHAPALSDVARSMTQARFFIVRPTIGAGLVSPHDVFHEPRRSGRVAARRLRPEGLAILGLPDADQHPYRKGVEQDRENYPEALHRQAVCEAGAQRGGKHASGDHQQQRRQVDVAKARGRQARRTQALKNVAKSARQRDRQADRRGGTDRPPQRDLAPSEERNAQKGAACSEQARNRADCCARREETESAGELARTFGSQVKQDLGGRIENETSEHQGERSPGDHTGHERRTER